MERIWIIITGGQSERRTGTEGTGVGFGQTRVPVPHSGPSVGLERAGGGEETGSGKVTETSASPVSLLVKLKLVKATKKISLEMVF